MKLFFFPKIIIYHIFQGALPLFQSVSKYSLSLCVSIAAQNSSCLKTESSLSLANPSSGSRSHIVSSLSIRFMTSGSQTKNPPLIQRLSPLGFSKKNLTLYFYQRSQEIQNVELVELQSQLPKFFVFYGTQSNLLYLNQLLHLHKLNKMYHQYSQRFFFILPPV